MDIPGWQVVTLAPGERPQPGDVIAEHHPVTEVIGAILSPFGVATATGHVGIVVLDGRGNAATASVNSKEGGKVTVNDWGLRPGQAGDVTIRRYVGKGTPI